MACEFTLPFSGASTDVLSKARSAVESGGGTFSGDGTNGVFEVTAIGNTISGNYTVSGQNLMIAILSKPFFLPCSTIESYLKNSLGL